MTNEPDDPASIDPAAPRPRRLDPTARRDSLLAAAVRAFARAPYDDVPVAAVAAEAGVSEALVFRYFEGKAALFTEVVRVATDRLAARQRAADAALPAGAPARDHVRASIEALLDHVAAHPDAWAAPLVGGGYPPEAMAVRLAARREGVDRLRTLLVRGAWLRHEYALWAFAGGLETACLAWVERGCPRDERGALVDAALGSLEGALGDWAG